jgi:hypothetical protein
MMVEMAVTIPVLLAVAGITINLLVFLGDCARFDRLAAEAVRTEASSPAYGGYGLAWRAQQVEERLNESFRERPWLSFEVEVRDHAIVGGGATGGSGAEGSDTGGDAGGDVGGNAGGNIGGDAGGNIGNPIFSFLPHQEEFVCVMCYRPWGFGDSFFGVNFSGITHTRVYCIDPYRPGVFL